MLPKFSPRATPLIVVVALALAAPSPAQHALAQADPAAAYPNRAVKVIVSAPPGGGLDIAARVVADRLAKLWGQPFVVENRPGAGGNLGTEAVAQAEPDGYTLLAAQPAPLTTNVVMYRPSERPTARSGSRFLARARAGTRGSSGGRPVNNRKLTGSGSWIARHCTP